MKQNFINTLSFLIKYSLSLILFLHLSSTLNAKNNYIIEAKLFPNEKAIAGHIQMKFTNNSVDTLQELWIHLWPNAYRDHYTPFAKQMIALKQLDFKYDHTFGAIRGLEFTADQQPLTFIQSENRPDMGIVVLNRPLLPQQSITLQTDFKVKLPHLVSRAGYGENFFAFTQWYPKFAVYENGIWNNMSYLEQGEFYSDFAKYDITITLPTEYKLAATSHKFQKIDTTQTEHTYNIIQDNIHDFAWFAAKDFNINTENIQLSSGKIVTIQAYTLSNNISTPILQYAKNAVLFMSEHVGEYPYDVCTVVETKDGVEIGMEYPTITLIKNSTQLAESVIHEVVHNWWYGILANNEREQPFLDESLTSYYEDRVMEAFNYDSWLINKSNSIRVSHYLGFKESVEKTLGNQMLLHQYRLNRQQALDLPSESYSSLNYGLMMYLKGTKDIQNLESYLGRKQFDEIIQSFYEKYQFQHITIDDLKNHFIQKAHKDVTWFFNGILKSNQLIDMTIEKVYQTDKEIQVTIKNKSKLRTPVHVALLDKNKNVLNTVQADVFDHKTTVHFPKDSLADAVFVDNDYLLPERNKRNNFAKINGIHSWKSIQIRAFGALENPTKNQLFLSPVLAGNKYDGFMLGMAAYNHVFPVKNFEYDLIPMYAFKSKQFNWIGNVTYHILPKSQKPIEIELGLHSKSFTDNDKPILQKYIKLQPHIEASFKKLQQIKSITHRIGYRNVQIWDDTYQGFRDSVSNEVSFSKIKNSYNTNELWYSLENDHALYPTFLQTVIRFDKDYMRQSLEVKQKIRYTQKGAFVHLRLFAGAFYYKNKDISFRRNAVVGFNMSGINGANDYLYDSYYFGRSENQKFASRQMMMNEGNFKVLTAQQSPMEGKTVNGLIAFNFKIDAPVKWLPIQLFVDMGYHIDNVIQLEDILPVKQFSYDAGFNFSLFNEAVEIYFPLLMSENFRSFYKSNLPKFGQRISFSLDISKLKISQNIRKDWTKRIY
ncbi:MAG: M1 family metallopeptidase [Chitinophagales bacterium]|nr:M1 family metallopeptidase [Chitinophagales bacterium]